MFREIPSHGPERLDNREAFWRDHQPWLASCGYMLRPRYMPDWKPSWEGTNKSWLHCEDGHGADVRPRPRCPSCYAQ